MVKVCRKSRSRSRSKLPKKYKKDKYGKFSHLKNDPDFRDFLDEIIDVKMSSGRHERRSSSRSRSRSVIREANRSGGAARYRERSHEKTPNKESSQKRQKHDNKQGMNVNQGHVFKSPSNTTLYSPGLKKAKQDENALIDK